MMNMGLFLFFSISSGFIITYFVKNYIKPPNSAKSIFLSAALVASHCLIYGIFFLRVPWTDVLLLAVIGVACVVLVESLIYLAVFRRGARQ